jgi:hypothetical protein
MMTHFVPSLHTLLDHVHLFINIYRMFTNSIHAIMAIVYRYLNEYFVLVSFEFLLITEDHCSLSVGEEPDNN